MSQFTAAADLRGGDFLFERLREEVARAQRHRLPLACLLFRVTAGADVDDATAQRLTHAASLLTRHLVRGSDVVALLGYGRFGVLANTTQDGALALAEALSRELLSFEFTHQGRHLDLELSYGASQLDDGKTPLGLLEEARAALDERGAVRQAQGQS